MCNYYKRRVLIARLLEKYNNICTTKVVYGMHRIMRRVRLSRQTGKSDEFSMSCCANWEGTSVEIDPT